MTVISLTLWKRAGREALRLGRAAWALSGSAGRWSGRVLEHEPRGALLSLVAAVVVGGAALSALARTEAQAAATAHAAAKVPAARRDPTLPVHRVTARPATVAYPPHNGQIEPLTIAIVGSEDQAETLKEILNAESCTLVSLGGSPLNVLVLVAGSPAEEALVWQIVFEIDSMFYPWGPSIAEVIDLRTS